MKSEKGSRSGHRIFWPAASPWTHMQAIAQTAPVWSKRLSPGFSLKALCLSLTHILYLHFFFGHPILLYFFFFPIRKLKSAEWFQNLLKKMVLLDSATEYFSYLVEAWKASSFSIISYFSLLPSRFAEANVSKTIWEDPLYFAAHCGTKFQHNVTLQLEDSRD